MRPCTRAAGRPLGCARAALTLALLLGAGVAWPGCERVDIQGPRSPKIRVRTIKAGAGAPAQEGQLVEIHYVGKLPDGTVFMDTHKKGSPHPWRIGDHTVIAGMDMAVRGMKPGEVRVARIPPELHWGREGYGGVVPPNATLTFVIERVR